MDAAPGRRHAGVTPHPDRFDYAGRMDGDEAAAGFTALGLVTRLDRMRALLAAGPSGLLAGEIAARPGALLAFLAEAGCGDLHRLFGTDGKIARMEKPSFGVLLFLRTRDSSRSIMAQAILGRIGEGRFRAFSAGSVRSETGPRRPDIGETTLTTAWPRPDPASFAGSAAERATLLNELHAALHRRLQVFTRRPFVARDRMALKARMDGLADPHAMAR
jgi:arsenate reductase